MEPDYKTNIMVTLTLGSEESLVEPMDSEPKNSMDACTDG